MDPVIPLSPEPQPSSQKRGSRAWIIVVAVLLIAGLLFAAVADIGYFAHQRAKVQWDARSEGDKATAEEMTRMVELAKNGNVEGVNAAMGRVKEQLEKSSTQFGGGDALTARAMASFLGKMQPQVRQYSDAAARLQQEKVLQFNISDRATLEKARGVVREFLAAIDQVTDTMRRSEELLRAELDAAKVPLAARDATLRDFVESRRASTPIQTRLFKCDRDVGEVCLAVLDLLEQNWGKWKRDEVSGEIKFDDESTVITFNGLLHKARAISAEKAEAKKEFFDRAKAFSQ